MYDYISVFVLNIKSYKFLFFNNFKIFIATLQIPLCTGKVLFLIIKLRYCKPNRLVTEKNKHLM